MSHRLVALLACLAPLLLSTGDARAEPARWHEEWPKFAPAEMALTGGLTLQVIAAELLYKGPLRNWEGGILFDDAVRDGIRLRTPAAREQAASTSDTLYYLLLAFPVIDAPLVSGVVHRNGELAVQTLAINLESYALAGAVALSAEKAGRARPMSAECERDPTYSGKCGDTKNLSSGFLSGHTAIAFAGAGVTCAHHLNVPLYGGGVPDVGICVLGLTAATASATLRVMSDNHYATDVLLGAGVGLVSGWVMPYLLHYRGGARRASFLPTLRTAGGEAFAVVAPTAGVGSLGLTLAGAF